MTRLYYSPPRDECFEDLKQQAMKLWTDRYPAETSPFYAEEKVNQIKDIQNVGDNFMYILAMFDYDNQRRVGRMISKETKQAINDRLIDGGSSEFELL